MAHEQPVFLADGGRPNRVLAGVIVDFGAAVVEMRSQRDPLVEEVGAGLAGQVRRGQVLNMFLPSHVFGIKTWLMPRKLRLEYSGAIYNVINRGNTWLGLRLHMGGASR